METLLIKKFLINFPEAFSATELFCCPRSGFFLMEGDMWKFYKHGLGICFEDERLHRIIDIHSEIERHPNAFDSWRLHHYLESLKISTVTCFGYEYDATEEENIKRCLQKLAQQRVIELVKAPSLYCFVQNFPKIS